jgi:hypothetical protein
MTQKVKELLLSMLPSATEAETNKLNRLLVLLDTGKGTDEERRALEQIRAVVETSDEQMAEEARLKHAGRLRDLFAEAHGRPAQSMKELEDWFAEEKRAGRSFEFGKAFGR